MDVRKGRCAYNSCTKYPSFNVDGSKTAVYCNLHAKDGMVDVRTRRFIDISRGAPPERIAPNDNETSLCTGLNADNLDFAGGDVRKRSSWALDGQHHAQSFDPSPLKCEIVQSAGMGSSKGGTYTSSLAFRRKIDDDTVGTAGEQTGRITSQVSAPLQEEHEPGEPIKTEMELVVLALV